MFTATTEDQGTNGRVSGCAIAAIVVVLFVVVVVGAGLYLRKKCKKGEHR